MTNNPVSRIVNYRGRTDTSTVDTAATWAAAENTSFSVTVGTAFRLRMTVENTGNASETITHPDTTRGIVRCGYSALAFASLGSVINGADAGSSADGANITVRQLSTATGTFATGSGGYDENEILNCTLINGNYTEVEFGMALTGGASTIGVGGGETWTFQVGGLTNASANVPTFTTSNTDGSDFSHGAQLGGNEQAVANSATISMTTAAAASSGNLVVVVVNCENESGSDGDTNEISGVTIGGNAATKAVEFTNGQGALKAGSTASIWWLQLSGDLSAGSTITATFTLATNSGDANTIQAREFIVSGGKTVSVEATNGAATDAATQPAALNATTSSRECLRICAHCMEGGVATASEADLVRASNRTWSLWWTSGNLCRSTGTGGSAQTSIVESTISTGTGASSQIGAFVSGDWASAYVAFRAEVLIRPSLLTNTSTFHAPTMILPWGAAKATLSQVVVADGSANAKMSSTVAVEVGDLVIISGQSHNAAETFGTATDALGNTITSLFASTGAGGGTTQESARAYYSYIDTAGNFDPTIPLSGAGNTIRIAVTVYQGPFTDPAIDTNTAVNTSDTTSPYATSSTGTLAQADELVVALGCWRAQQTPAVASPFIVDQGGFAVGSGYAYIHASDVVSSTASVSTEFTLGADQTSITWIGSFKKFTQGELDAPLYTDDDTFYAPTVLRGVRTLQPSLTTDADTFYAPTVTQSRTLSPSLVTDADTFYSPTVTTQKTLLPSLVTDADTFHAPTILRGTRTLTPALYTDADTFYAPDVAQGKTLFPALYSDADTFYSPTVTRGARTLQPSLYTDTDTFYSPAVTALKTLLPSLYSDGDTFYSPTVESLGEEDYAYAVVSWVLLEGAAGTGITTLQPALYTDADTFYSPTVTSIKTLAPALYTDADTFYAPQINRTIYPALYTDTDTIYAPTVTRVAITLQPQLYTDTDTFYAPTVTATRTLLPALFTDGDTFYSPNVLRVLTPALYSDADTFYSPTVTRGVVTLLPSLYTDDDVFYSPAIITGEGQLFPDTYVDDDTFYSPTITRGALTLQPALYTDTDTFYSPSVFVGETAIFPALYSDADTFYAPTVLRGARTLSPALYSDADTIYAPSVASRYTLTAALYTDADVFYSPRVNRTVRPALYTDADTIYAPSVTSRKTLAPALFTDTDTFYAPTVTARKTLLPSLYNDADTFYSPTVAQFGEDQTLLPALYTDADTFYSPTILRGGRTLQPALVTDADTFYSPRIRRVLKPALYSDADTFYAPTVTPDQIVRPGLVTDADTFYSPTITTGAVTIFPGLYVDLDTVYGPFVFIGQIPIQEVHPGHHVDDDVIYSATVSRQRYRTAPRGDPGLVGYGRQGDPSLARSDPSHDRPSDPSHARSDPRHRRAA